MNVLWEYLKVKIYPRVEPKECARLCSDGGNNPKYMLQNNINKQYKFHALRLEFYIKYEEGFIKRFCCCWRL